MFVARGRRWRCSSPARRKLQSELGASVVWGDRSATLAIPAFESNGDPRALQIAALGQSHDGFFEELAADTSLPPHVVLLFVGDEAADPRALGHGYVLTEATPLMTAGLADRVPTVNPLIVEEAELADVDELVALDPRSGVYRFDDFSSYVLVAHVDGRIVGKTQLMVAIAGIGYLTDMVVDAEFRRRGIGRALVTAAEALARSDGSDATLLASTEIGRHLYTSLGYDTVSWLHSYVRAFDHTSAIARRGCCLHRRRHSPWPAGGRPAADAICDPPGEASRAARPSGVPNDCSSIVHPRRSIAVTDDSRSSTA